MRSNNQRPPAGTTTESTATSPRESEDDEEAQVAGPHPVGTLRGTVSGDRLDESFGVRLRELADRYGFTVDEVRSYLENAGP